MAVDKTQQNLNTKFESPIFVNFLVSNPDIQVWIFNYIYIVYFSETLTEEEAFQPVM